MKFALKELKQCRIVSFQTIPAPYDYALNDMPVKYLPKIKKYLNTLERADHWENWNIELTRIKVLCRRMPEEVYLKMEYDGSRKTLLIII